MKKRRIRSAIPIYSAALVWLLVGFIKPRMLLNAGTLLITAAISAAVWFGGEKLFPGKEVEEREHAHSSDDKVNRQIEEGRARLDSLQRINDALPDPVITAQLDRMKNAGEAIFNLLEKDVNKAGEVHRFMNYYLPTAEKLMNGYAELVKSPSRGENIQSALRSVENSLEMIAQAFEKQLDSLYRDRSFDMESDISVLETILKSEGLVNTPTSDFKQPGREAPKAQAGV